VIGHGFITITLSYIVSEIKRYIGRESHFSYLPYEYDAAVQVYPIRNIAVISDMKKTRMADLPDGDKSLSTRLLVSNTRT